MSKLLREFYKLDYDRNAINEAKVSNKPVVVRGILQCANKPNQNKRIYPREILEREVENYKKAVQERRAVGECDHPERSIVELKNVSHLITEIAWDGDQVVGTVEVLDTPSAQILKSLLSSGVMLGISSRGVGGTIKNEAGFDVVDESFQLLCFDIVSEPSTNGAWLHEGREIDIQEVKKSLTKNDKVNRIVNEILNYSKR